MNRAIRWSLDFSDRLAGGMRCKGDRRMQSFAPSDA